MRLLLIPVFASALMAVACGGGNESAGKPIPQLAQATPAVFSGDCAALQPQMSVLGPQTTVTLSATVPAGTVSGVATGEHCRLVGRMNQRVSPVDGNTYAIGFEVRAPKNWNGRFFYQANGGTDGFIGTASGPIGGAGATSTALSKGFAVLSSDAGHPGGAPFFGLDPQARLDYGYNAVAQLTPMARELVRTIYGKPPDRSYLGGCSNGGRHALVAASRFPDLYDGILAGNAGFNLPSSAVAQLWGAQQFATVATGTISATVSLPSGGTATQVFPSITTSFTVSEMNVVASAVLARCDALDGLADGIVGDIQACKAAFSLSRDVPVCSGARDGTCLTSAQHGVLGNIFRGVRNSAGQALYSDWPFDAGLNGSNWRVWKFNNAVTLSPGATAFIFTTPPQTNTTTFSALAYAMSFNVDSDAPKIFASTLTYPQPPMTFMTPPPTDLTPLRNRGAKLMIYHGVSDPTFSFNDTARWYDAIRAAHAGDAGAFARLYPVPGMNHCSGGPATDKFDMLGPLVDWVEKGIVPETVTASARPENNERPSAWSGSRTRPLCPWPKVARYKGTGDIESAASFSCG